MNSHFCVRAFAVVASAFAIASPAAAQHRSPLNEQQARDVEQKLEQHPSRTAAAMAVHAAEARVRGSRVQASSSVVFANVEEVAAGNPAGSNVTIGLEHEFTPANARRADISIAEAEVLAAQARLAGVTLSLASRAERALMEVIVHRRIVQRLADEDTLLQRAASTLNTRFSVGDARYIDVIRLRTERLRVQADIVDAQAEVSRAFRDLSALVALDTAPLSNTPARLPEIPQNLDSVIASSPAAAAARATEELARAAVERARAHGTRVWSGSVGMQRFQGDGEQMAFGPALGVALSLPLFNRRAIAIGVETAGLEHSAAARNTTAVMNALRAGVASAYAQIEATARRMAGVDQQLIAAAREERQAALLSYANGELTLAELLDFERSLSRSEVQLLESYDRAIDAWDRANQLLAGVTLEAK